LESQRIREQTGLPIRVKERSEARVGYRQIR
jgi:hypothetical protein